MTPAFWTQHERLDPDLRAEVTREFYSMADTFRKAILAETVGGLGVWSAAFWSVIEHPGSADYRKAIIDGRALDHKEGE